MPCYSPLRARVISGPGGRSLLFGPGYGGEALSLPCGRCIGCRLERSRQWAVRLTHEAAMHEDSCFLTLTYSDEHLPPTKSLSVETCQLFMKRLRERLRPRGVKLRFFLAGEYGEKFSRPHYHMILFGYSFPDKTPLQKSGEFTLYRSDELDEVWGLGFCSIGEVSFDSAAYVASYALKKVSGKRAASYYGGRQPEFVLMSRRPGIGAGWFSAYKGDVYPSDEVIVRGRQARPPRYYDKLWEKDDPASFEILRAKRAERASQLEELVMRDGSKVLVKPGNNAQRLAVRKTVAEARLRLKSKSLED